MYKKCVYIVPLSGVPADLPFKLKKGYWCCTRNGVYKMCMHRSCFWSISRCSFETEKKVTGVVRGTVYTKCVYIVPVSGVDAELPWKLKRSYWCWKRNVVYKMCIHRSCLWRTCSFTFETEKRLLVL